jgi:hypothetical protein
MSETKIIKSKLSPHPSIDLLDLPRYRLEGKFIGGGWWESREIFLTEEAAYFWYCKQKFPTKSTNLRVVKAV